VLIDAWVVDQLSEELLRVHFRIRMVVGERVRVTSIRDRLGYVQRVLIGVGLEDQGVEDCEKKEVVCANAKVEGKAGETIIISFDFTVRRQE
jgi:hypothetical protein